MSQVKLELQLDAVLIGGENALVFLHHLIWLSQEILGVVGTVQRRQVDVLKKGFQPMTGQIVPGAGGSISFHFPLVQVKVNNQNDLKDPKLK